MKNCLRRASPAVVRDCDTGLYAASAREKAIACLSTDIRLRCNSKVRSDGNARAQRKILDIPAEFGRFPQPISPISAIHRLPLVLVLAAIHAQAFAT